MEVGDNEADYGNITVHNDVRGADETGGVDANQRGYSNGEEAADEIDGGSGAGSRRLDIDEGESNWERWW